MLFPRVVSSEAEKAFTQVYNVAGGTVTAGGAVVWDITSPDGVRVSKPATATLSLLVGIATAAIADSAYGLVQVYGYNSATLILNGTAGGTDIAAGHILVPVNGQWYLAYSGASDGKTGFVFAGEAFVTATTPAAATKKAFLRCM